VSAASGAPSSETAERAVAGPAERRSPERVVDGSAETAPTQPTLRAGVEISQPEGADYWVVNAPGSNRFFRIGGSEQALLSLCDGTRTVEAIAYELGARLGRRASPKAVGAALQRLAGLDIVTLDGADAATPARQDGPPATQSILAPNRQTILFFRIRAFDPTRLIERAYPYVRPFLGVRALAAYIALWLAAGVVVAVHAGDTAAYVERLFAGNRLAGTLIVAYLVNATLAVGHEFAHAFVLRRAGRTAREMGFLLIYFNPAFYTDVSEGWRLSRRQRVAVGAAGVVFHLTVAAVAILGWALLEGGFAADLLFLVGLLAVFTSVLNLTPLLRLDGYYILADLVRVPNLRSRAFGLMRALLRGRLSEWRELSSRERRIYLTYGILGSLYSLAFLGWMVYWILTLVGNALGLAAQVVLVAVVAVEILYQRFAVRSAARQSPASASAPGREAGPARG
jgi:putative peptide zinc metalloprotease protein